MSHSTDAFDIGNSSELRQSYTDFRADIRGCKMDQEIFVRKVRTFAEASKSTVIS